MSNRTITLEIAGMHCASCGILVDDCMEDLDGVVSSQTDLRSGRCVAVVDDTVSDDSLKDALGNLRTPRQLFKFLHRLIEEHCHRHTEDAPRWTIDYDTFRTTYGAYMRDLEAFDRGYGHG